MCCNTGQKVLDNTNYSDYIRGINLYKHDKDYLKRQKTTILMYYDIRKPSTQSLVWKIDCLLSGFNDLLTKKPA